MNSRKKKEPSFCVSSLSRESPGLGAPPRRYRLTVTPVQQATLVFRARVAVSSPIRDTEERPERLCVPILDVPRLEPCPH